jgi:two-component system NtrC family sensor kinase
MIASGATKSPSSPPRPRAAGPSYLVALMILAIGVVTTLAWWDSEHESQSILDDLGREQLLVAQIAAKDLGAHLDALECRAQRARVTSEPAGAGEPGSPAFTVATLVGDPATVEQPGAFRLFLAPPDTLDLLALDGRRVASSALRDAIARKAAVARLGRPQASELGLPARTAMAGLAYVRAPGDRDWAVAAVATAARQRDRESRAFRRLVLGIGLASSLILAFGGLALRNQRRELQAQRELDIAAVERERDQQLASAERAATMGTFAMGVVHEVSTPLGVILGRAEQLRVRLKDDERAEFAAKAIVAEVDRIQVIIRRFLDMARGGQPSLERTCPNDLAQWAAASTRHRFVKAGVSLTLDVPADLPDVHCDRPLLEQAIVNLLLNACDACSSGGRVELAIRSDAEEVAFVVTDDGVGISPEAAARAADPFFTTKPAGRGTGLGLAIASEIAKSHRGALMIGSHGDRGTRACLELPAMARGGTNATT